MPPKQVAKHPGGWRALTETMCALRLHVRVSLRSSTAAAQGELPARGLGTTGRA